MPTTSDLWWYLVCGYPLTVAIEMPVLLLGLSRLHPLSRRLLASFWLTACTYPIVVLVLPLLVWQPAGRTAYLIAAETFAPLAECGLFYAAFLRGSRFTGWQLARDMAAIVLANLASFGLIEALRAAGWMAW